jgi:hypothetical protein
MLMEHVLEEDSSRNLWSDLNFTISVDEVWGAGALPDPLAGFFRNLFETNHMVDVQSDDLVPT